jgi:hypothetical protein
MARGGREEEEDESTEGLTDCDAVGNLQVCLKELMSNGFLFFLQRRGTRGTHFQEIPWSRAQKLSRQSEHARCDGSELGSVSAKKFIAHL